MSFFREMQTQYNDVDCLKKSLEDLGFKPVVNEKKVQVRGHGNERREAEIILRKEDLQDGGDIGFSKGADGNYSIVTDTYVMRKAEHKMTSLTEKLNLKYGENKARAIAKKNGWRVLSTKQVNGATKLQFVVN